MVGKTTGSTVTRRKGTLVRRLAATFVVVAVLALVGVLVSRVVSSRLHGDSSLVNLYRTWDSYDYQGVYDISANILRQKTFNNAALMLHGYAAFFLSLSETDTTRSQDLLDESINALRLALLTAKSKTVPQLEYMLGKAYFYKNTFSSYYYYADLAVQYLTRARKDGYKADDIPEFLGLSYASLDMTMESISAFTEALLVRESDLLLLSIAEQYYKAGQYVAAGQYLYRISQDCKDEKILLRSYLLRGQIAVAQENYADAAEDFQTILKKNENSADAYYYLGVIYEKQGDSIKARSQWRRALRIQPNHPGALKKMAEFK
ncbi:MAG: tetratricopeptide repeat protein [Treponemataceae bacterium]|nr:tetratricopeptide repeat protein [Treponemataceae bacterium]